MPYPDLPARSLLACFVVLTACPGNHNDLAQDTSSATVGGAGGAGAGSSEGGFSAGGSPPIIEPDGPPKLSVVNAIVDRGAMALCFLESPVAAGDEALPWPSDGIDYAHSATVSRPGAPVPGGVDIELVVLTGDLSAVGGANCRDVADDPFGFAGLEVLSLGVVPGSTFLEPRSLLVAVTGCFGGETHDGKALEAVCGPGYGPDNPTPGVVFAPLSRITSGLAVGLQVINATAAFDSIDVYARSSIDGMLEQPVAQMVVPGAAAPFPPSTAFSSMELAGPSTATLRSVVSNTTNQTELVLGDAMENGGVTAGDFINGKNIVLVAVGPSPGAALPTWSNLFAFVALRADP